MENQEQFHGIAPSPSMTPHLAHYRALKPLEHLDVEMSLAIGKEGLDGALLADLVATMSKGVKRFGMTEHETVFEIMRFPDGYDLNNFYRHDKFAKVFSSKIQNKVDEKPELVEKAIRYFLDSEWDYVKSYCVGLPETIHGSKIIPYCYLQRKLTSVLAFKGDRQGANMALKGAIDKLLKAGFLKEVARTEMQKKFSNNSRAFRYYRTPLNNVGNEE